MEINTQYLNDINILIIDDSKTSSMLIKQQLVSLGIAHERVSSVSSYQETIKIVGTRHYDILIMDYHLEQTLTGHELTTLLYKNNFINETTGVLIISGDSRQETVLTSLSGKVKHFITKPINTKALSNKIHTIYREGELLGKLSEALKSPTPELTGQLLDIVEKLNFAISLESSLIDLLISHGMWDTLTEYLAHTTSANHPTKQYAYAKLLDRSGQTDQAIQLLSEYIVQHPLSLKIMDCLVELYEQQGQWRDALHWALKGFELTPSMSDRAIHASQLAAKLNQREVLIHIGDTFANHISLADSHWLTSIITYTHHLETAYFNSELIESKKSLLAHFDLFIKNAEKKLTEVRRAHLVSYSQIFISRIWLCEGKLDAAHNALLNAIAPYYENLAKCPIAITHEALPLLEVFGELWLSKHLRSVVKVPNNSASKLPKHLSHAPFDIEALKEFYLQLNTTEIITANDIISRYEKVISDYPYATGVKMDYLDTLLKTKTTPGMSVPVVLSALSKLNLPPNWERWLESLTQAEPRTSVPAPFSITSL
ncbi:response regulator [Vibrio makurazakiensis]|uniref:response regulator n=1 Tax=Vibrio makurazakiensis TaxID=2910250 RepID=UPI003D117546